MEPLQLDSLPDVLTVMETAAVLRVGRNGAYEAIKRGEIPVLKIGRRLLVPKAGLRQMLSPSEVT